MKPDKPVDPAISAFARAAAKARWGRLSKDDRTKATAKARKARWKKGA